MGGGEVQSQVQRPAVQSLEVALRDGEQVVEQLTAQSVLRLGDRPLLQQQQRGHDGGALQDAHPRVVEVGPDADDGAEHVPTGEDGRHDDGPAVRGPGRMGPPAP